MRISVLIMLKAVLMVANIHAMHITWPEDLAGLRAIMTG